MMELPHLKLLRVLTVEQIAELQKFEDSMPRGGDLPELIERWGRGEIGIWALGEALVLTEITIFPKGKELSVYGLAGRGIIRQGELIMSDLKIHARDMGCRWIGGQGIRPAMRRLWNKLGLKPTAEIFEMEI